MSSPQPFECVDPEVWRLNSTVSNERRNWLLAPPSFDGIFELLKHRLTLEQVIKQRATDDKTVSRVVVKLRTSARAIDLFHNSSSGYRAQYYTDVGLGDAANKLVLEELLPIVVPLVLQLRPSLPIDFLDQSFGHPCAKVWIYQGLWLRHARSDHRVLEVPRWQSQLGSEKNRPRKLARWGCLAPDSESAFVIKGGFVFPDGRRRCDVPGKNRATEIHAFGFT
ncbi:hypothetical protein [Caballeronia sp. LZ016]|uniref:hypothetical protein n=1 Tax=Caballeronia sp. LZ016 TaxID=3038554 RepID=UPI002863308C|nr:hypothetical protein [Caballeronia sp. LZ016]MDR5740151.1 hypothetical protein [Caballeronia sp. LZ016]